MAYAVASDLTGLIPDEWRIAATDDNGDETAEAIAAVLAAAEDEINGTLSTRYAMPADVTGGDASPAATLRHATRYLAAELCYGRRGMQKEFPFEKITEAIRLQLRQMAQGKIPLYPTIEQSNDDVLAVTEDSRVWGKRISF